MFHFKSYRKTATLFAATAVIAVGSALAFQHYPYVSAQPAETTPAVVPPTPVSVKTLNPDEVMIWSEFSGRMEAVDFAEIRPQVSGRITQVRFTDGQSVKAGTVLFVIDPRPFEAALAKAQANLVTARTNAEFANTEFERAAVLIKSAAIAQRFYDERANAKRVADAAILVAEADVKQAELNLDYAHVKAPISGRLSRVEITAGNLVEAGPNAPVLTSIVSNDGIYADFDVDEQTYVNSIRANADTQAEERKIPVELTAQGDSSRIYRGTIHSFDNRITTASGTIRARARFDNKDGSLVPGMFVSVRLASSAPSTALLVPDRAIGSDQSKRFVFVVGADSKASYREVSLGASVDHERIVLSGLKAGERVIVDGLQHVQPNAIVAPTEASASSEGAPQGPPAQGSAQGQ
jgi:multidrug efflux system membrane fusion protein